MHNWMMAATLGAALLAGCGGEPTAARAPLPARHDVLSASISGPTQPQYNVQCAYTANASGGTPPYSYTWVAVNGISGYAVGNVFYGTISSFGPKSLYVTVTDANGGEEQVGISRSGTQAQVGCQ